MRDSESLIMKTLIEQCDSQIKKAKKGKKGAEEDVDRDLAELFSTYSGKLDQETLDNLREKHRGQLLILKKDAYDRAISKLEGVKAIIKGYYPQLS